MTQMKLLEERKKEEAPVINGLQHKLKTLYAFTEEKKGIFLNIPEVLDMKNFQRKDCIFL